MALVVAAKTNLADDVVPEGQFYDQQEVAAGKEPVSEESVPDFIRSSKDAATAGPTEGFLQDTEDPAGYTQAGHCYTMRIGFAPWNGMSMASHFQTAYAQSLITGYKKGGDVAQSRAYLRSKCQEQCDASDDCTGFYYGLKQYWIDRANDGGDGTGSALGACQLFYQHSDICVTDCLASPYFAKALEARGSDYETGMVTWLHSTWAGQCESYCGQPPAGRSDLQGKSHWSILQGKNGYPTCTDPVGDCAPEIARYEADKTMCPTWMHPDSFTTYKKSMTAETPTEPPTDAPTDSPTDAPTVTDAPTDSPTDAPTVTDAPTDAPTDASTCNRQDQGGFTDTAGWNIGGNAVTTCGWMEHICKPMSECKCYEQGGDTKCQWTYLQAAHSLPAANCGICRGFKIPDTYGRSSRYHTDSWAHYNSDAATQVWTGNWICPAATGSCGWDAPTV